MNSTKILSNCSFIKCILMILVILYHSCVFWTGTWWDTLPINESSTLGIFAVWLNSFHIYAFTLISGYIFAYKRCNGEYQVYTSFLKNKAKHLIIPYIFVVVMWVLPISWPMFHWDFKYVVKKFFLANNPHQLWFLWMLFDVFVIIWPLWQVIEKHAIACWLICITFYCIGAIGNSYCPNIFCIWTAFQYVTFFCMGIRIYVGEERLKRFSIFNIPWYIWTFLDFILFCSFIHFKKKTGLIVIILRFGVTLILHIVGAIMAFVSLQKIANCIEWETRKSIKILFLLSLPMYLFHQQIIYFTIILFDGRLNPFIHAIVNFSVAIIGSFLISSLLMRWKVTRILLGKNDRKIICKTVSN